MNRRIVGAAAIALTGAAALGATTLGATAGASTRKAAQGRADSGTTYASIVRNANGYQYAAGSGTDKLFGSTAITYRIKLSSGPTPSSEKITANPVVLYTKTGTLVGTATATLTFVTTKAGTTEKITNGKLNLPKGTGALKGHSFVGTFTGSGNLTTNTFVFNDKGTYR